jgi:hypothetical protein
VVLSEYMKSGMNCFVLSLTFEDSLNQFAFCAISLSLLFF